MQRNLLTNIRMLVVSPRERAMPVSYKCLKQASEQKQQLKVMQIIKVIMCLLLHPQQWIDQSRKADWSPIHLYKQLMDQVHSLSLLKCSLSTMMQLFGTWRQLAKKVVEVGQLWEKASEALMLKSGVLMVMMMEVTGKVLQIEWLWVSQLEPGQGEALCHLGHLHQ
uniref:Uncharacterized protein n=1 Tax=Opuntia streptacantha TaxID=393608 RepID=A0A7C9A9E0_OPUST